MSQGILESEHRSDPPEVGRDPVRQLRGRLAAPVGIITAGDAETRCGLTISSLVVAEGDPALAYCLLGPSTEVLEAIEKTQRFVVHVCGTEHRALSDVFAGFRPTPEGPFTDCDIIDTPHGPVMPGFGSHVLCSLLETREESFSVLVTARIDEVVIHELADPLLYFRGGYRSLAE